MPDGLPNTQGKSAGQEELPRGLHTSGLWSRAAAAGPAGSIPGTAASGVTVAHAARPQTAASDKEAPVVCGPSRYLLRMISSISLTGPAERSTRRHASKNRPLTTCNHITGNARRGLSNQPLTASSRPQAITPPTRDSTRSFGDSPRCWRDTPDTAG